jgi:hypothetical protein
LFIDILGLVGCNIALMKRFLPLLIVFLSGCGHQHIANFSLVSTKATNLNNQYESIGSIEGADIAYIIFIIPTGTVKIDNAVNNTLLSNNADYITNTFISRESFYFPYIGGYQKYKVKGEGWRKIDKVKEFETEQIRKIKEFDPETGEPI